MKKYAWSFCLGWLGSMRRTSSRWTGGKSQLALTQHQLPQLARQAVCDAASATTSARYMCWPAWTPDRLGFYGTVPRTGCRAPVRVEQVRHRAAGPSGWRTDDADTGQLELEQVEGRDYQGPILHGPEQHVPL